MILDSERATLVAKVRPRGAAPVDYMNFNRSMVIIALS